MPDIVFPNTFTDLDVTDPDSVSANIYEPRSTPRTLEVINGRLSKANLIIGDPFAPHDDISRNEVRGGSFVHATPSRGATANRDYFKDFWPGDWDLDNENSCADRALAIIGASTSFHTPWGPLPKARGVYISWHISTVIDTRRPTVVFDGFGKAFLALFVNGVKVTGLSRRMSDGRHMMVQRTAATAPITPSGNNFNALAGYPDVRHWSGHWMVDSGNVGTGPGQTNFFDRDPRSKGFHNASIRIAHQNRHVRVRTSHITVFPIR